MKIKSTLVFAVTTTNGIIEKTDLAVQPTVNQDGTLTNMPEQEVGVLWLVNARVFGVSDRNDIVMFDNSQTIRDDNGLAVSQGGYIKRDGAAHKF
jgi:hypothetical protein